jgi:hypothetical protein
LLPLLKEVNNLMKLLQTLLGKFVFTFCGPWHCFQVWCVLNLQVFGGFLTWPLHHAVDIELECMSWTLDLWLQWTGLGKTSWPTNKGCQFCDQRCAHSSCGNGEKLGEKNCWILEPRVVVPLSFTWCYRSFGGGFPSIPNDGKLDGSFRRHIAMIKAQYCYPKRIGPNQTLVWKVLFFIVLDL